MKPTPIYRDHTGQWREQNPYPEFNEYCIAQDIEYSKNPKWANFEQSITYHPFPNEPNVKQGEVVMAQWQWQFKQFYEENYRDCGDGVYEIYKTFEEYQTASAHSYDTRQIWVAVTDSAKEEEVKGLDLNKLQKEVDEFIANQTPESYTKEFEAIDKEFSGEQSPSAQKVQKPAKQKVGTAKIDNIFEETVEQAAFRYMMVTDLPYDGENDYIIGFTKGANWATSSLQQENDKLRDEVAKLKKKHEQIRQVWISTDKSITKLKEAIQQYVSDKGDSYEEFEADYLTP